MPRIMLRDKGQRLSPEPPLFFSVFSQSVGVNYVFLASALAQQGPWHSATISVDGPWCRARLQERIDSVDWAAAREDVRRFTQASEYPSLELWSRELFLSRLDKIKD